jgi:tetratricopeptide (TPR) repeat protein
VSDLDWLTEKRIAVVGKLGGVSRRQLTQLLRQLGAEVLEARDQSAQIVVIGAEESPEALAGLLDEATQAKVAAGEVQLLHETELWQRLGLVESEREVRQLYTPAQLAELVGVAVAVVRRWHQRGFIAAAREVHRLPYFDFAEVAVARRLAELTKAGASTKSIERTVAELKRHAPHVARPLAELPTFIEGKQLLLWHEDGLIEPSGQRRFDFDATAAEPAEERTLQIAKDRPHSVEQLLALAGELEEESQLAQAGEMYRAALAASGPRADICFLLAELLYRQGDLTAARERYSMAIELDEDFVEARANLGCVLAELGERDLALAALEGALEFHPDYSDAHYHLARLLDEAGQASEALAHWQRFLELSPDSPWVDEARERIV